MSHVLNLFRSTLFFVLLCQGFQSVSEDGSYVVPPEVLGTTGLELAKEKVKLEEKNLKQEKRSVVIHNDFKRAPSSVLENFEVLPSLAKKTSNLCATAKSGKGLNFKTPTSYLSSVLKKAGAVDSEAPLYQEHSDSLWTSYLSKHNFKDVSSEVSALGEFKFDKLKNGTLIILEKSCFKKGTVAVYCDGEYYATRFVKTSKLLKKVNSEDHKCQIGSGMRLVVEGEKTAHPDVMISNL